jgi:hypothetical protein
LRCSIRAREHSAIKRVYFQPSVVQSSKGLVRSYEKMFQVYLMIPTSYNQDSETLA